MYSSRVVRVTVLAGTLVALPTAPAAHEIPPSVTALVFVRPGGQRLHLVVRVPLAAMRDVELPLRGPGYLDLPAADSALGTAAVQWIASYVRLYEDDRPLAAPRLAAVRVSLPSDRSFQDYRGAVDHVRGPPLPASTEIQWQQAMLDVLFEYAISSDRARFSVDPALAHLGIRTTTVLRFVQPDGSERVFQYVGDPGLVRLDPRWHQSAARFVSLGFGHILQGMDHVLFVLCLVIPFRKLKPLVAIVTSFTVAHSITLAAAALGMAPDALWFPPLIEMLIALSIVYMAFENIVGARLERRWLIAFVFGLVHGFGFAFLLRDSLQFAGGQLVTALLSFNLGVELGQVAILLLAVPILAVGFRYAVAERPGTIILSALVAHSAWHWMTERASALRAYQVRWPAFDLALLAGTLRVLMVMLLLAGALWALSPLFAKLLRPDTKREAA